jgi:hypothetical protein
MQRARHLPAHKGEIFLFNAAHLFPAPEILKRLLIAGNNNQTGSGLIQPGQ